MSLTTALSVATTGLRANGVQSDLVARNIANASTEGYTRKEASLITRNGGVFVESISRDVDSLLDRLDRSNISAVARAETLASGLKSYTDMLGQPDDATSPSAGLSQLYSSFITLTGTAYSGAAQLGVLDSAQRVAGQISSLSVTVNELGREVDLNIRYDVSDMNERLVRIGQINARLLQAGGNGVEGAELQDELGRLLDDIAGYMDIQVDSYADGAVNVYTSGGTELVRGRNVATIAYDSNAMTLMAGDLEITPGKAGARGFSTGSLAGLFELATTSIPQISNELNEMASLMIERFTAADPTLSAGEFGLFADAAVLAGGAGGAGVAGRLIVNPKLLPAEGGDPSLLVKGLGTATTLPEGSITLVQNMMKAVDERPASATLLGDNLSLQDFANSLVANQQQQRVAAERSSEATRVAAATISASRQNLQGVNVDDELQKLLVIEQSFAANAKVLTSVQLMLDSLMDAV